MSKKEKSCILALFLTIGICLVSGYFLLQYIFTEERRDFIGGESYRIKTDTILEDLSQGKTDVFTPQEDQSNEKTREYVEWTLADYDLIAQALHELVWEEPLDEWKMSLISFDWDCEHIDKGPYLAHFRYFKVEKLRERKSRFVSNLYVTPLDDDIYATMHEDYPRLCCWNVIDPAKMGVSAEEALDIAERNGGAESRTAVGNSCHISVILNPANPAYGGWNIRYSYLGTIDQYYIDPKTGEVVAKLEKE
jgi:hypothetical protein